MDERCLGGHAAMKRAPYDCTRGHLGKQDIWRWGIEGIRVLTRHIHVYVVIHCQIVWRSGGR